MEFGWDIMVIYYLCNSSVVNLQQILQCYSITAMLNELCIPNSVQVVFQNVLYLHIACK